MQDRVIVYVYYDIDLFLNIKYVREYIYAITKGVNAI